MQSENRLIQLFVYHVGERVDHVVAPPGSGKTTAVRTWLDSAQDAAAQIWLEDHSIHSLNQVPRSPDLPTFVFVASLWESDSGWLESPGLSQACRVRATSSPGSPFRLRSSCSPSAWRAWVAWLSAREPLGCSASSHLPRPSLPVCGSSLFLASSPADFTMSFRRPPPSPTSRCGSSSGCSYGPAHPRTPPPLHEPTEASSDSNRRLSPAGRVHDQHEPCIRPPNQPAQITTTDPER